MVRTILLVALVLYDIGLGLKLLHSYFRKPTDERTFEDMLLGGLLLIFGIMLGIKEFCL